MRVHLQASISCPVLASHITFRARKSGFLPKSRRGWRKSGVACSCGWRVTTDGGLSPARVPQATEGGAAAFAHASPQGDRAPSLESVRRLRETRRSRPGHLVYAFDGSTNVLAPIYRQAGMKTEAEARQKTRDIAGPQSYRQDDYPTFFNNITRKRRGSQPPCRPERSEGPPAS